MAHKRSSWHTALSLQFAAKPESRPTASHIGVCASCRSGMPRYVLLGDMGGKLYIFGVNGDLVAEYQTVGASPVTAITQYPSRHAFVYLFVSLLAARLVTPQRSSVASRARRGRDGSFKRPVCVRQPIGSTILYMRKT